MRASKWKVWVSGAVLLAGWMLCLQPAEARFPGMDITLWDEHQAKEDRKSPAYLKFHELVGQNKYDEAMQLIDRTHLQNPEKGTPLILKALLLYEMKDYKQAYLVLQKGRSIQHRHPAIPYAHCQLYRSLGNVEFSERSCQIAVHQHANSPDSHYAYAQTLAAMGNMQRANEELARAAELDASNPLYHFERGMNFFTLNDLKQAEQAFLKALSLNPDDLDSGYQLGYLYTLQRKFEAAEDRLNRVWQTRRNHPQVESARALIELIKRGETGKLPARVDPHQYHLSRSQSLYQAGEYGLSLFEIQTASGLKPEDKATSQILVALSSLLMRFDLTEQALEGLMNAHPEDKTLQAKGLQELGDISVMRGLLAKARDYYDQSLKLGDPDGLAKISLEELPAQTPESAPALDLTEPFAQPANALNRKGEVFAHYGMYQRALALYSLALRSQPDHLMSKLNMAMAYYKMGSPHKTITLLERALISHPDHEHILSHRVLLAKAYAQKGDREGVVKNLKLIKQINPSALQALKTDPVFKDLKDNELFGQ